MPFDLLPAIDVAGGRSVRPVQGHALSDDGDDDPMALALAWQDAGARWIHLVDLDAAYGRGSNAALLTSIVDRLDIDVQLSGGVVDDASLIGALSTAAARIVVGTAALADPAWCERALAVHGDRLAVGLDVHIVDGARGPEHRLVPRGSSADRGDLWDTIARLDRQGCARYIVTDVADEGMLTGPNLDLLGAVGAATDAAVVASAGVGTLEDLSALLGVDTTLAGVVVGKALHAGRFSLVDALAVVTHGRHIRRAGAPDADRVAEVIIASRHANVPAIPPPIHSDAEVRAWVRDEVMSHFEVWVVDRGRGTSAVLVLAPGWIEQLYVVPGETGHGQGTALLVEAKRRADQGLHLWTFASNVGAQRFYERHGFTEQARTDGDNEEGAPDILYHWSPARVGHGVDEMP